MSLAEYWRDTMRIGSLATQTNFLVLCATVLSMTMPAWTLGQTRYASPGQGPMQAIYNAPANGSSSPEASRYCDAYGNPMIVPTGFHQGYHGGYGNCGPCNGGGPGYGGAPCDGS